jgi:hypothetical protein
MVERGEAGKLSGLFHGETPEMKAVLRRIGSLLGGVQELAREVNRAFPQDIEKLKAEAQAAALGPRAPNLFQAFASGRGPRDRQAAARQQEQFAGLVKRLFSDPFAVFADTEGRLTAAFVDDTTRSVLYDNAPVIPVVGLLMRRHEGRWYFELPTNVPGGARFMPQSRDEYSVIGSVVKIFDQAVRDLSADVRTGKVASLDDVSRKAGEKAFLPMAMAFYAYNRLIESRAKAGGG